MRRRLEMHAAHGAAPGVIRNAGLRETAHQSRRREFMLAKCASEEAALVGLRLDIHEVSTRQAEFRELQCDHSSEHLQFRYCRDKTSTPTAHRRKFGGYFVLQIPRKDQNIIGIA